MEGTFEEVNEFSNLYGANATLGLLWTPSRHLSLGVTVDLPWTAKAEQEKTVKNEITTFDSTRTRILDITETVTKENKDVEFNFPFYWAVGMVWRWSHKFYTSLDVSQTRWSDFSFKAEGEERINPLDSSLYQENPLDDT
ncbi:MAG: hypothetical protein GKR87_08285 [Kiritimatiellae bacterium]|nr:hypothetical protein [Kiritimatiellia bacterium]